MGGKKKGGGDKKKKEGDEEDLSVENFWKAYKNDQKSSLVCHLKH